MGRTHTLALAAILIALSGALPDSARAGEPAPGFKTDPAPLMIGPMRPETQSLYQRGLARFEAHDYRGAVVDFQSAFALDPVPDLLFAEAQAERLRGDCTRAVILYQRFLATNPPRLQSGRDPRSRSPAARSNWPNARRWWSCSRHPPQRRGPTRPSAELVEESRALSASALGVAALGVGVGFWMAASGSVDDAGRATTLPAYDWLWVTAESRRTVSTVAVAAGATLLIAAGARFAVVRRQRLRGAAVLSLVAAPGTLTVAGAF